MAEPEELVFVGFNSRIAALDRRTGQLAWSWVSPKGSGYVAVIVERDQLFASVNGYTYCLDPWTGREVWRNELSGMGTGTPCLATAWTSTGGTSALAQEEQDQASASACAP